MRATIFIIVMSIAQVFAGSTYSQNTRVSLYLKNVSTKTVLSQIEDKTQFYFIYDATVVDVEKKVSIESEDEPITKILDQLFEGTNIIYKINNRQVALTTQALSSVEQQIVKVSGKVKDNSGSPLPGVTVLLKGTAKGTITDSDGKYTLPDVPDNATLQFSFVGMKTQEIPVSGRSSIDVIMAESTVGIDEVVAIGYGTQRKVNLTGSVASTTGKEIVKSPAANIVNSLIGKMPGLIINNRSGEPGRDDPTIFIRGRSTTGNNNPLIIIDGVERTGLGRLNPYDIESISVLKDASAAIYGARASNGVILVTTKRGKSGKPTIDLTINQGFAQPARSPIMADSYTFAQVYNEIEVAQGRSPKYTNDELQKFKDGIDPNYPNTDWFNFILKPLTPQRRSNISLSGGNEQVDYFISVGETSQSGHFNFNSREYKQYNFRSNVDANVTKHIKLGLNLAGRLENRHFPYTSTTDTYIAAFLYLPTWQPYWPGTNYLQPLRDSRNIVNALSDAAGTRDQVYKSLESSLTYKIDLPWVKGLSIFGSINYDAGYNNNKDFYINATVYYKNAQTGEYTPGFGSGATQPSLSERFDQTTAFTINSFVNYERSFDKHNIKAMFGYEQREGNFNFMTASRNNYVSPALPELFAGSSVKNDQSNDGSSSKSARQNLSGRLTYDYAGKYLAQAIFRYDGSQNFPAGKRFGFFPGISLGWRLSEESFIKNLGFIDNLKIRGSYGELGNDLVSSFQYLTSYKFGSNYVIGNNDVLGLVQSGVPNPNITWEVAKTTNLGFESSLWKGLLGMEFDLFKTRRSNILTKRTVVVPDYTGLQLPDENIGIVDNKGFELQLSHVNTIREFKYSLSGNFSFARNKVIFADEAPAAEEYQKITGRPIGSTLYYKAIGIFATQADVDNYPHMAGAKPGDIIYEDVNKDGAINARDQIRINQTPIPEIVYGLMATMEYKGFDFSLLLQGQENASTGGYPYDLLSDFSYTWGNFTKWRAEDRWTPEHTNATQPRSDISRRNNNNNFVNTHWMQNMGFLRLKNLELGYNISSELINKLNVKSLRVYVNGQNLFYLHDHLKKIGLDPEATDLRSYGQDRIYNIGINLTF